MTLVRRDNLPLLTRLVFPSIKDVLFLAFLFVPLMTKESGVLHDGDTGWHIRNGEHILATWEFPTSGLFLLYAPGCPLVRLGMAGGCGDGNHPSPGRPERDLWFGQTSCLPRPFRFCSIGC